jgi:ferredoxin
MAVLKMSQSASTDGPHAAPAPGGDGLADCVPRDLCVVAKSVLWMAVPRGDGFGDALEAWPAALRQELPGADLALRSLKYLLLALFLFAVGAMPAAAIEAFLGGPYGTIADVKMLNFFRYLGVTGGVVLGLLAAASVLVQNFWCRYLCPYGALTGLAGLLSPMRIRRQAETCIDCAKCAKACPSLLPVDRLTTVRSAECTACLECVAVCPAEGALALSLPRRRRVPAWAVAAGVAGLFLCVVACAQWTGHWRTDVPSRQYFDLLPHAQEFAHP